MTARLARALCWPLVLLFLAAHAEDAWSRGRGGGGRGGGRGGASFFLSSSLSF